MYNEFIFSFSDMHVVLKKYDSDSDWDDDLITAVEHNYSDWSETTEVSQLLKCPMSKYRTELH